MARDAVVATEVFKALGDPIRWDIVQQMAQEDELAASVLEDRLPVAKPTISYHVKILTQAGLADVHKRGRNYFYTLRRDVLAEVLDELSGLLPNLSIHDRSLPAAAPAQASGDSADGAARLLTW